MTIYSLFLSILLTDRSVQMKMNFVTYGFRYEDAILTFDIKSMHEF
jgi:hypothetical protein